MCQFSQTAGNQRDAEQGEDLVVSRAPHGCSNWITEPGKPEIAVCNRNTSPLAVQIPGGPVRGATFVHQAVPVDGNYDFVRYLDGDCELTPLNKLPIGTGVRVLLTTGRPSPVPATISSTVHNAPAAVVDDELVGVGVSRDATDDVGRRRSRRNFRIPLFDRD